MWLKHKKKEAPTNRIGESRFRVGGLCRAAAALRQLCLQRAAGLADQRRVRLQGRAPLPVQVEVRETAPQHFVGRLQPLQLGQLSVKKHKIIRTTQQKIEERRFSLKNVLKIYWVLRVSSKFLARL